jgi:hypothetical protein
MDSMSFIVGVKLSAALAGSTPAPEIRTTLAATDTLERTSNSRIGLFMTPPLVRVESTGRQHNKTSIEPRHLVRVARQLGQSTLHSCKMMPLHYYVQSSTLNGVD